MSVFQALILGVVQGVCEFLPISSSGHLVLLQKLFGVNEGALSFDIIVHLGTLISICFVMREKLAGYLRHPLGRIPKMVVLGTVPTVVIVLIFSSFFKSLFETGLSLGIGFIFTAVLLYIAENHRDNTQDPFQRDSIESAVSPQGAVIVGVAQGIAVIPAISRSGSTIAGGIMSNFGRQAAIEFAFLMSIPVTLLAVAQDALKILMSKGPEAAEAASGAAQAAQASGAAPAAVGPLAMIVGFVASAVVGLFTARFMLTRITKIKLTVFSIYLSALGLLILIDQLFVGAVFDKIF